MTLFAEEPYKTKGPKRDYSKEFEERITSVLLNKVREPAYSEKNWKVNIVDEGGGEFLEIPQLGSEGGKVRLAPSEWEPLRNLINKMVKDCRDE